MNFFKKYFNIKEEDVMGNGEYQVCCPFPHKDLVGNEYMEKNPSAHINPKLNVLHCKVCGEGWSEASLLSKVEGIPYREALRVLHLMDTRGGHSWENKMIMLKQSPMTLELIESLGLTSMIDTLQLGFSGDGIDFPVFMYGDLMDVRNYNPNRSPKVLGTKGSKNMILPFDLWREDKRDTLLVAGEKDMAIGRVHGFNTITFTGGEGSFPKLFKHSFKGRHIYIIYDNDSAGRDGAMKVAHFIKEAGGIPHIVTGHYEVCIENGGDLWDFFMKYGKTAQDLKEILSATPEADGKLLEKIKDAVVPLVPLGKAVQGQYANSRFVRSRVTVTSVFEDSYPIPDYVRFEKTEDDDLSNYPRGTLLEWAIEEKNVENILLMMDGRITKEAQRKNLRAFVNIPSSEKYWRVTSMSAVTIYKCSVKDSITTAIEDGDEDSSVQLVMYSIGQKMYAGKQYEVTFKPVSHPLEGQKVVGIVTAFEESASSIESFKVTPQVKDSLKVFQVPTGMKVADVLRNHFERSKGFIGTEARYDVMLATDMFYHTPLDFTMGGRVERAYLDVMIIGDPRTMKSQTAKKMREMYELGIVTSLKTATIAGLIGGSDKVGGSFKTKIGLIPQAHKGAVILEEFSGGVRNGIINQLTEIRSSGRVRLLRVDNMIDVPARVRMLSISNPMVNGGGFSLPIAQYPSGINVIMDLVGASEDIARYDFFVLVEEPKSYTSPLSSILIEPYDKESYLNRIRWVWSRKAEQVEISSEVAEYIVQCAGKLNSMYDCSIKLFGAEAWKKLARVAIAIAGLVVSTDETFERLVVTKEHVSEAAKFLVSMYDNQTFKLRGFVENERAYNVCRPQDIHALQQIYNNYGPVLEELEVSTYMTTKQLNLVSGLEPKDFSQFVSRLGASKFIQWKGERIAPTGKFRNAMKKINRNVHVKLPSEQ